VTIQELGSIGEFVAAIATIATLIYLALQIRHSSTLSRSAAHQEVLTSHRELLRQLLTLNPELEEIQFRGMRSFASLEPGDQRRFHHVMVEFMLHCQNVMQLREKGILDRQEAAVWVGFTLQLLRMPGSGEWWESAKGIVNPDFRAEMDHLLQEPGESIAEVLPFYSIEGAA